MLVSLVHIVIAPIVQRFEKQAQVRKQAYFFFNSLK